MPLIRVTDDGPAPCRHCEATITWDGLFAVWRDEDGLAACLPGGGPHQPVPPREDIEGALMEAEREQ